MAKNKVSEWSSTPSNNTDIGGIDIAEGCAPSGINNGIRELMAQIKDMITGADGDNQTVGGNLTVLGTTTLATDLAVTDGGTGASNAADARTNLGLGTMSTQAASNVAITGGSIAGITDLAVADGGTGASTLAANAVLIGNGTSPVQTVAPGTTGNVLTSNGTAWVSSAPAPAIGVGQTWQNLSGSRSANTTYTNSTSMPIMVSVGASGGGTTSTMTLVVNGVSVSYFYMSLANQAVGGSVSGIVPSGSTYQVSISGGLNINVWAELR